MGEQGKMSTFSIRNCRIVNGRGDAAFPGDLLIRNGLIESVLPVQAMESGRDGLTAGKVIDGKGLTAVPGFIDTHSHNDMAVLSDPVVAPKLRQGITSEILGQDGFSVAPVKERLSEWAEYLEPLYGGNLLLTEKLCSGTKAYLDFLMERGICANYGYLVPHGNLRFSCMAEPHHQASKREVSDMADLLSEELDQGALGLSTGLIYPPCCFSDQREMELLCAAAARSGKPFVVHQRNESDSILASMEELFRIAEKTGVHLHISHFKIGGFQNMGILDEVLKKIDAAPVRGIHFTMDIYPYVAGCTSMAAMLPPWIKEEAPSSMLRKLKETSIRKRISRDLETGLPGWDNFVEFAGFENIYVSSVKHKESEVLVGKSLLELGESWGTSPQEALFDLLVQEENQVSMVDFYTEESVLEALLKRPESNLCTDGLMESSHPRAYGSFPRLISRYVKEKGLLSMEEAVSKMTSRGAEALGITDRGSLEPGMAADLLLVDESKIADKASFRTPDLYPEGIVEIFVNGRAVVSSGDLRDIRPGQIIRSK